MANESHLDDRYFVDEHVYNCPLCNRRHVAYSICGKADFHWTHAKPCYAYFVQCDSCNGKSMHLSFDELSNYFVGKVNGLPRWRFSFPDGIDAGEVLDQAFFYSVPTSFFVMDERIPRKLRELLTEAEGCLKSNFLTGASACARKIIYELSASEKDAGDSYEDRIKSLKNAHPEVDVTFFDSLLTIQQVTSAKVHENSYDGWESKHLRVILASLKEILHEIYVVPALRADRRNAILGLKQELLGEPGESHRDLGAESGAT